MFSPLFVQTELTQLFSPSCLGVGFNLILHFNLYLQPYKRAIRDI